MKRFELYSKKGNVDSKEAIALVDMMTYEQAEAYFAGMKQLKLEDFRKLFLIEVKDDLSDAKTLLFG